MVDFLCAGCVLFTASADRVHTLGRNKRRELLGAPVSDGTIGGGGSPAFALDDCSGSNSRWRRVRLHCVVCMGQEEGRRDVAIED